MSNKEHLLNAFVKAARENGWCELTYHYDLSEEPKTDWWLRTLEHRRDLTDDELDDKAREFIGLVDNRLFEQRFVAEHAMTVYRRAKEYQLYVDEGAEALMMWKLSQP